MVKAFIQSHPIVCLIISFWIGVLCNFVISENNYWQMAEDKINLQIKYDSAIGGIRSSLELLKNITSSTNQETVNKAIINENKIQAIYKSILDNDK